MKEMKKSIFVSSLLYLLIGVLLIIFPSMLLKYSIYVMAAVLALVGAINIISFFVKKIGDENNNGLFTGLIALFLAFFVCWSQNEIKVLIPLVLGFVVVVSGILTLQEAVNTMRIKSMSWIPLVITALVKIGIGLFAILYKENTADFILRIIGAGCILSGLSDFVITKYVTSKIKSFLTKPAPAPAPAPAPTPAPAQSTDDTQDK